MSRVRTPAVAAPGRNIRPVHRGVWALTMILFLLGGAALFAEPRFPPPDFESGHVLPETTTPPARAVWLEYLDIAVLVGGLIAATYFIYRKRSRTGLVVLSIGSILYFGFWKKGCVCAIGSVQNVTLALFDSGYVLPVGALAFFVLPLAFAVMWGRSFCAGICPHGALQDLVLLKPLKVPAWLEQGLGILPYIYLGAGVLFAATGSAFIICQYDPFIPIFRMNGRVAMVVAGIALLLLGVFVGRPYCRFLCPFGALLKIGSVVSKWRVRVTPDYCTQCRLCEASCPFGAMRLPSPGKAADAAAQAADRRRLLIAMVLLPVLIGAGAWLGWAFAGPASRMHPTVVVAEQLLRAQDQPPKTGVLTPEDRELDRVRQNPRQTLTEAMGIRRQFNIGTPIFGGWVGLVIGIKLLSLALHRRRTDYEPDRGDCFSCARCFEYCPNELVRRGVLPASAIPPMNPAPAPQVPAPAPCTVAASACGCAGKEGA